MGNTIGRGRKAKVMKMDGETFKLNTPAKARDVVKDYPGHALLESEAVKIFGIRAKPLEPEKDLKPKKIYFLVELPNFPERQPTITRRVRSGIQMSAKDRLELLMLSRRSVSDLSVFRPMSVLSSSDHRGSPDHHGPTRLKMTLPRSQVERLVGESKDDVEVARKIIDLYMENSGHRHGERNSRRFVHWKPELGSIGENNKPCEKQVSFAAEEGEIQVALDSHHCSSWRW